MNTLLLRYNTVQLNSVVLASYHQHVNSSKRLSTPRISPIRSSRQSGATWDQDVVELGR